MTGEVRDILEASATEMRQQYHYSFGQSDEWYVVLPTWLVYSGGRTVEQYAEQFERDLLKMTGLPLGNLVGFETEAPGGGVYRYRATWCDGGSPETPEEIA